MRCRVTMYTKTGRTIRYRAKETNVNLRDGQIIKWESRGVKGALLLAVSPDDLEAVVVRPWWRLR